MEFDVVVVGSINYDISVMTPRLPMPGETLIGSRHFFGPGGKGANQAVAVARLGGRVALVGRLGRDEWGAALLSGLAGEGVDVAAVDTDSDAATGIAVITIDSNAENTIVGNSGANMRITPEHIASHANVISGASVVLAQLEIPLETVEAVAELATGTFVLNPAPAQVLPGHLLERVGVLIPNRSELSLMAGGVTLDSVDDVVQAARSLRPGDTTVVTLGGDGAVLIDRDGFASVPSFPVDAIDPTGAGDAFCGAFAFSLSRGTQISEAVRFASAAGALAVSEPGAQAGMPHCSDVEALLGV
ncbi:MAG TPA: ribokinase [Acidimicrobiia bacterium]